MDRDATLDIVHDLSLAAWFGGAWMGAVGLNGATIEVDDHRQRTRVANAGWFGWAPVVGTSVAAHLATAALLGRLPTSVGRQGPALGWVRAVTTSAAVATTLGTGLLGRRVVRGGDVPVANAVRPVAETPDEVARAQRGLRVAQWLVPAFTGVVWLINGFQRRRAQAG